MNAGNGGTHTTAQNQEAKEGQGDLKAVDEAEDHEHNSSHQKKDP